MSFVQLAEAKLHLRVDGADEDAMIGLYINAAEQAAVKALDRGVYADGTALQTAMTAAPAALTAATVAKEAAVAAAEAMTDSTEKSAALQVAEAAYMRALVAYRQVFDGIVVLLRQPVEPDGAVLDDVVVDRDDLGEVLGDRAHGLTLPLDLTHRQKRMWSASIVPELVGVPVGAGHGCPEG